MEDPSVAHTSLISPLVQGAMRWCRRVLPALLLAGAIDAAEPGLMVTGGEGGRHWGEGEVAFNVRVPEGLARRHPGGRVELVVRDLYADRVVWSGDGGLAGGDTPLRFPLRLPYGCFSCVATLGGQGGPTARTTLEVLAAPCGTLSDEAAQRFDWEYSPVGGVQFIDPRLADAYGARWDRFETRT